MSKRSFHPQKAVKRRVRHLSKKYGRRSKISRGLVVWRFLKGVVFMSCLSFFAFQSTTFLRIYKRYPTTIKIEFTYPDEFEFPAVTFCSYNPCLSLHLTKASNHLELGEIPKFGVFPNGSTEEILSSMNEIYFKGNATKEFWEEWAWSIETNRYYLNIQRSEEMRIYVKPSAFLSIHSPFAPVNPLYQGDLLKMGYMYKIYIRLMCKELCLHDLFEPYKNMTPEFELLEYPLELCLGPHIQPITSPSIKHPSQNPAPNASFTPFPADNANSIIYSQHQLPNDPSSIPLVPPTDQQQNGTIASTRDQQRLLQPSRVQHHHIGNHPRGSSTIHVKRSKFCAEYPDLCERPENMTAICAVNPALCKENPSDLVIPKIGFLTNDSYYEIIQTIPKIYYNGNVTAEFWEEWTWHIRKRRSKILKPVFAVGPYKYYPCYTENLLLNSTDELMKIRLGARYKRRRPQHYDLYTERSEEVIFPRKPSFLLSIHSPFVPVNPSIQGNVLEWGYNYKIYIRLGKVELQSYPYDTDCIDYEKLWSEKGKQGPRSQEKEFPDSESAKERIEVDIFYRDRQVIVENHVPEYRIGYLFSYIGGLMGCWLGVSVWAFPRIAENILRRVLPWIEPMKRYGATISPAQPTIFSTHRNKKNLMTFLKKEAIDEEMIELTRTGFEINRRKKADVNKIVIQEMPSAAALVNTTNSGRKNFDCLFCDQKHPSQDCYTARKLTLEERRKISSRKGACFSCLRLKHVSRNSKFKDKCMHCDIEVRSEERICSCVPKSRDLLTLRELEENSIVISDLYSKDCVIDLLIGADVAGLIMTGNSMQLTSGVIVLETSLVHTLIGTVTGSGCLKKKPQRF
ncbi:hypothetical protein HNY73_015523 [Argiope bruennichi]|uniref:Uncharacterized protein n=1 Tax=Argiope bruennichi TaxID=94029 RepID=A0A8T0ESW0_ARGBR|nr:hypothetical protein HNY73_015523 [Argiope bruennichi]